VVESSSSNAMPGWGGGVFPPRVEFFYIVLLFISLLVEKNQKGSSVLFRLSLPI
jgi:hypothetical protein